MFWERYLGESTTTNSAELILLFWGKFMASFVYNAYKNAGSQNQWYDYLQKKEFHDDLTKTFQAGAKSIRDSISDSTFEIVGSLDEGFGDITRILDSGFSKVSNQMENLGIMLDWRLSEVIDQLRVSNLLQENIALLLRVPDFQKERQYFIEQGFKHYENVRIDADLYEDALKNLLEAEKRETTDYVVLHRIGMIYLYANKKEIFNPEKAEAYFRRAAKYAIVESNPAAQRTLNILAGNVGQNLSTQETMPKAAKSVAAKSYFQAGVSCYAQGKFSESIELCEKAFSLSPYFLEAGFLQSKSLAALGNGEKSAEILRGIIETKRFYAVKTASDDDLATKPEVQSMLKQLRDSAVLKASEKLDNLRKENINHPQFTAILSKAESFIQKNTFLDALSALDELAKKHTWEASPFVTVLINNLSKAQAIRARQASVSDVKNMPEHIKNMPKHVQRRFIEQTDGTQKLKKQSDEVQKRWKGNDDFLQYLKTTKRSVDEFILFEKEIIKMEEEQKIRLRNVAEQTKIKEEEQKIAGDEARRQAEITNRQKQNQIKELLEKAEAEEEMQNKKWLFKNYDLAIYFYEEAAKLGSYEAQEKLKDLKNTK